MNYRRTLSCNYPLKSLHKSLHKSLRKSLLKSLRKSLLKSLRKPYAIKSKTYKYKKKP